jgi:hypothetical protein
MLMLDGTNAETSGVYANGGDVEPTPINESAVHQGAPVMISKDEMTSPNRKMGEPDSDDLSDVSSPDLS